MVFVTGATGLLGSHLLYWLSRKGNSVCALKRQGSNLQAVESVFTQYPDGAQFWNNISWVEGDVLEPETFRESVRKVTHIFHCAAVVSFSSADRDILRETNLKGTENVAALCLEYNKRLCYVSSIAALGDALKEEDFIDEETPVIPERQHSVYSQSKGEAERIVWKYVSYGLNAVIVCPSVILGAGFWNRSSARLFLTAVKGIPFYTRGVTGYVDVRDVCEMMIRLAHDASVKGERYVLNGGNYTYQELFSLIARAGGKKGPCFYLRPWMTEIIWRLLAVTGKVTGRQPAFTRETARSAHHRSYYSSAKLLALYPDFRFYSLRDTLTQMQQVWLDASFSRDSR